MTRPAAAAVVVLALSALAFAVDADLRKQAKDADSFKRSDAARALAKDGSPDAAKLLVELLSDENPYVRDHTVEACGKLRDEAAVAVVAGAARSKDALLRANVAAAVGPTRTAAALDVLRALAAKDADPAVRAAALGALSDFRTKDDPPEDERAAAASAIAASAAEDATPAVRAAALEAAGRLRGPGAADLVRAALAREGEDDGVRCVARMELRYVAADEAVATFETAAADPSWRVRAQTVEDAFALRRAEGVPVLCGLVADPRERVAAHAHRALMGLSGKDIDRDPELWRAWWEAVRETWTAPDRPVLGEPPVKDGATRATYHGLAIDSDHVVFVLDASGSMKEPAGEGTRWDLACAELEKALGSLPDGALANVIVFQETARAAFPAPKALAKKTRKELAGFARRTSPGQSGDLLGAVLLALGQEDADTVFLLSDGAPSHGAMVDKDRVRAAIRARNRTAKLVVNCVGLGAQKATERSFLEGVARDAGGRTVYR